MSPPPTASTTRDLLTAYLDAHLATSTAAPVTPAATRHVHFRVGPFQFLLNVAALGEPRGDARPARIQAEELVPTRYRDRLDLMSTAGPDLLSLKGGRIQIVGCLRCGELDIPPRAVVARSQRPDAPWILGSVQQPPSFVLDSDMLQLHFARRVSAPV